MVDTKSTWPASHSVVHRFERSDGLLAELSSRTFWSFAREFSSFSGRDAEDGSGRLLVRLCVRFSGSRSPARRGSSVSPTTVIGAAIIAPAGFR